MKSGRGVKKFNTQVADTKQRLILVLSFVLSHIRLSENVSKNMSRFCDIIMVGPTWKLLLCKSVIP